MLKLSFFNPNIVNHVNQFKNDSFQTQLKVWYRELQVSVQCRFQFTTERTQSSGWLWDQQYPILHKMSIKTGLFSGLEVKIRLAHFMPPIRANVAFNQWVITLVHSLARSLASYVGCLFCIGRQCPTITVLNPNVSPQ